jgi:hypothetical protein
VKVNKFKKKNLPNPNKNKSIEYYTQQKIFDILYGNSLAFGYNLNPSKKKEIFLRIKQSLNPLCEEY